MLTSPHLLVFFIAFQLMTAPRERLQQTTYNVTAATFTPAELTEAIQWYLPDFSCTYAPDFRQVTHRLPATWGPEICSSL